MIVFDREDGAMLEALHVRPELVAFEAALRERIERLAAFEDERFARIRGVDREPDTGDLVVVSEFVPGTRLSDLLDVAQESAQEGITPGVDVALGYLLEALPAIAALHAAAGVAHGAIAPARTVLTPAGQAVSLDTPFGEVLERLHFSRKRLWAEFGLAMPASAGPSRFDVPADITQVALNAVMLVLGRPLREKEYPDALASLMMEVVEVAQIRGSAKFASAIQRFLLRALPLPGRKVYASADEAAIDIRQVARQEIGLAVCRRALVEFIAQTAAGLAALKTEPAPVGSTPDVVAEPFVEEQAEAGEQAEIEIAEAQETGPADGLEETVEIAEVAEEVPLEEEVVLEAQEPEPTYEIAAEIVEEAVPALSSESSEPIVAEEATVGEPLDEPAAAKPLPAELIAAEPFVAEPAGPEPFVAETFVPEPAAPEPIVAEPIEPEPAVAEPIAWESFAAEPAVPEPITAEPFAAEPAVREPVASEPFVPEPVPPEPVVAEPVAPETAPEPLMAEPTESPVAEPAVESPRRRKRFRSLRGRKDKLRSVTAGGPASPAPAPSRAVPAPLVPADRAAAYDGSFDDFSPATRPIGFAPPPPSAAPAQAPSQPTFAPAALAPPAAPVPMPQFPAAPSPYSGQSTTIWSAPPLEAEPPPPVAVKPAPAPAPTPVPLAPPSPPPSLAPAPIKLKDSGSSLGARPVREPRMPRPEVDPYAPPPPLVERAEPAEPKPFPWKLAAAAIVIVAAGIGAGRWYLPTRHAEVAMESAPRSSAPVAAPKAVNAAGDAGANAGHVDIQTQPPGAKILLDGQAVGESPLKLDVTPGRHVLTFVSASGSVKRNVRVDAGKSINVDVPLFSGWVAIFAPIVLQVSENGKAIGSTEDGRIMLAPGRHDLTLANQDLGYVGKQAVEIESGEVNSVTIEPHGTVNFNAIPWAEVWIDGKKAGDTPLANAQVPLGVREIVFKNPEYGERKMVTTVRGDTVGAVSVDFTSK